MGSLNFLKYRDKFESEVVCAGVSQGKIGKLMQVNVRPGRLSYTKYARHIGGVVDTDIPLVIDYYGYLKRSRGFSKYIIGEVGDQIKSMQTRVVFFASLKIEEIAEITSNQYLKGGFSEFKSMILHWRGFENKKKKINREQNSMGEDTEARL